MPLFDGDSHKDEMEAFAQVYLDGGGDLQCSALVLAPYDRLVFGRTLDLVDSTVAETVRRIQGVLGDSL